MKAPLAIMTQQLGSLDNYHIVEHDPGQPKANEVRFNIKAAAVNYVDTLVAAGKYQVKPNTPFIPGAECAGVVESVGGDVNSFKVGDRVFTSGVGNAFCQAAIAPSNQLYRFPDTLSFEEAATFKVSYSTSYHALVQRGKLQAGESVLIMGAAGGVGYAAIQIAKALNAGRVIASVSNEKKRELALRAGADVVIHSRSDSWRGDLKDANNGRGIDIVVDPVGGEYTEPAFRSLAWGGRHLVIGFAGGSIPRLPTNLPLLKGAALIGVDIRQFTLFEAEKAAENIKELFALHASHNLRPFIGVSFTFKDFREAMSLAATGNCVGRIVLRTTE